MQKWVQGVAWACSCLGLTGAAQAQLAVSAGAGADTGGASSAEASGSGPGGDWIDRYKPEPNLVELGLMAGVLVPARTHNLQDEDRPNVNLESVAPEIGLRAAYFPLEVLGIEADFGFVPTGTEDGKGASLWALRGHAIGQLPSWRVTPFVLLGMGALGVSGDTLGSDVDPSWHFGAGIKAAVSREILLRLDLRDNVTQANDADAGEPAYHPEFLLGASWVFGRSEPAPPPPPPDSDGDGVLDADDACPKEHGPKPGGCPPKDRDGDGILDDADKCPTEKGIEPTGCPDPDPDKDGVLDPVDRCPATLEDGKPPDAKDGCPSDDPDGDGIPGAADQCPDAPENKNGYQDDDGCPDEKPLAQLVGTRVEITQAILFGNDAAEIDAASAPILDAVAQILKEHPEIQLVEVGGHASRQGDRNRNKALTQKRAEAVARALEQRGVARDRLVAQGYGLHCPLDAADTPTAHEKNRRVEFKVLHERGAETGVERGCAEATKNGIKPKPLPKPKPWQETAAPAAPEAAKPKP
jgi:outer membrane protein OmpA-like peptidoglycan-associated protein